MGKPASGSVEVAAGFVSSPGGEPSELSSRSDAEVQPGSLVSPAGGTKSTRPSKSSSSPLAQAGVGSGSPSISWLSVAEVQPGSVVSPAGGVKSTRPSKSLSRPSAHSGWTSAHSLLSVADTQSGSAVPPAGGTKSILPSPSLSMPSWQSGVAAGETGRTSKLVRVTTPGPRESVIAPATTAEVRLGVISSTATAGPAVTNVTPATTSRSAVERKAVVRMGSPGSRHGCARDQQSGGMTARLPCGTRPGVQGVGVSPIWGACLGVRLRRSAARWDRPIRSSAPGRRTPRCPRCRCGCGSPRRAGHSWWRPPPPAP